MKKKKKISKTSPVSIMLVYYITGSESGSMEITTISMGPTEKDPISKEHIKNLKNIKI